MLGAEHALAGLDARAQALRALRRSGHSWTSCDCELTRCACKVLGVVRPEGALGGLERLAQDTVRVLGPAGDHVEYPQGGQGPSRVGMASAP